MDITQKIYSSVSHSEPPIDIDIEPYRVGHILLYDTRTGKINLQYHALSDDMRAQTSNDLGTVFCIWDETVLTGHYENAEGVVSGLVYQIAWNIVGINWKTKDVTASVRLFGEEPVPRKVGIGDLTGPPPTFAKLEAWLKSLPER